MPKVSTFFNYLLLLLFLIISLNSCVKDCNCPETNSVFPSKLSNLRGKIALQVKEYWKKKYSEQPDPLVVAGFLDILLLIGEENSYREGLEFILNTELLNLFKKNLEISTFISALGGLISAYYIEGDQRILSLIENLGEFYLKSDDGILKRKILRISELEDLGVLVGGIALITGRGDLENIVKRVLGTILNSVKSGTVPGKYFDRNSRSWVIGDGYFWGIGLFKSYLLNEDEFYLKSWSKCLQSGKKIFGNNLHWELDINTQKVFDNGLNADRVALSGILIQAGELEIGKKLMKSYLELWKRYGLIPHLTDLDGEVTDSCYSMEPGFVESLWYFYRTTTDKFYLNVAYEQFNRVFSYCKREREYYEIDIFSQEQSSLIIPSSKVLANLRFFWYLFSEPGVVDFKSSVFTSQGHQFQKIGY